MIVAAEDRRTVCSTTIGTNESLTTGFRASSLHLEGPALLEASYPKYLLATGDTEVLVIEVRKAFATVLDISNVL